MKKLVAILSLLCLLLTAFSGCHGSIEREAFALPETFDTEKKIEISFWAKNDTNINQVQVYEKAIADFQDIYPNVTVKLKLYTDYGRLYNDVITNIATGTTPNVCITYPDHIATYLTGGDATVVPLDDLLEHPKYGMGGSEVKFDAPTKEEIVPQFLAEGFLNGAQYAIPYMRSTEACYINKTYVEKLGYEVPEVLTWDFIWEVSQAATAKDGNGNFTVNGQNVLIPCIYKSTDNMMIQYLRQTGAGYATANAQIQLFNDTTKGFLEDIAAATATGAFSTFKISSYPANFLNAGQCIFAIDSTAGATWMGSDAPLIDIPEESLVKFETVVRPVPQADPKNLQMISQGPSMCLFNKEDPQTVLASWLFAQFMLTNEVQIAYAQTEGYVPVTLKAQHSDTYQDYLSRSGEDNELYYNIKMDATKLLLDNVDDTFVTPVFNGSASLRDAAGQLIESTVKAVRRKQEIAMEDLFAEVSSLYRLDQIQGANSKQLLGKMPLPSVLLLCGLGLVWVIIAIYALAQRQKMKKINRNKECP